MHSVKQAGLVDEYHSVAAQKNWEKTLTSIVKYEKDNAKKGPFRDFKAILKELKKERDSFLKAQTEAKAQQVVAADGIFTLLSSLLVAWLS